MSNMLLIALLAMSMVTFLLNITIASSQQAMPAQQEAAEESESEEDAAV